MPSSPPHLLPPFPLSSFLRLSANTIPSKPPTLLRSLLPFSSLSAAKPKWNSNHNLVVTNPVLSLMESCNSMRELKQIQAHMIRTGLMAHRFPASRVIAFCALSDSGDMSHAQLVFDRIPELNTYIWNTIIRGYTRSGYPESALSFFRRMVREQIEVDNRSFVFAVKACEQIKGTVAGEVIHCVICKLGFCLDVLVRNALMHLYVKYGRLVSARELFDGSCKRDVVSWTTMIDGYSQNGVPDESLKLFFVMLSQNVEPNEITMITVLSACSQLGILSLGKSIHRYMEKSNVGDSINLQNALLDMYAKCGCVDTASEVFDKMATRDVFSWTSMINGYAKCGDLELARHLFDRMPERNVISWSTMIAGYEQNNQAKEALDVFREMMVACVDPIDATLVSVLSACAQSGCLDYGRWIHHYFIGTGRILPSISLANALMDMYAKCGALDTAAKVFSEIPEKDMISWNSMIMAYAVHGYSNEALILFDQMKGAGFPPDNITFIGVLSACSHGGLVVEGRMHFTNMKVVFGIEPKAEHYACMIDLFGRLGLLEDATGLINSMPMEPDEAGWGSLLNACKMHGNLELGKHAGDKLLALDPGDSGIYMLLSNLYASTNKWDDLSMVRRTMRKYGVKKTPGCSSIEVDGKFFEFFSADQSHSFLDEVYKILDEMYFLLKWESYVPIT